MRQALNRALNACFLVLNQNIVGFLYRLILHLIVDEEYFDFGKYMEPTTIVQAEFKNQFMAEFEYDAASDTSISGAFDFKREWSAVEDVLYELEQSNPILGYWFRA